MIRVRGLAKRYGGRVALEGVHLEVAPGSLVAVVGPNGSGKSTLLRCIAGLMGHEGIVERPAGAIGFLPQSPVLPPLASAAEVVALFRALGPGGGEVPLPVPPDRRVGLVSGGEQQRIAIAALLAMAPPVLLLDEPTADLDAPARETLFAELARRRDAGTTVLLTTPAPFARELAPIADRIVALEAGRLREIATGEYFPAATA